jgi:ABC-type transport system involved in cytochrome c biogenesis permease subunit
MGLLVAAIIGFTTLIVAHHLSLSGDTMAMMQAVLDTNFWLSTHVVVITIGYSACFMAGLFGLIYIFRGVFMPEFKQEDKRNLIKIIYGTLCFALLFSFLGTILGGIWADQSWGRFWGWDPKENGALLIVIWNALILHTRLSGHIKDRGLALMAIFGNVVTAISWFGVNLLGIGLHSYGFTDNGFMWLFMFIISQLTFMALGALPHKYWISKANG